MASRSICILLFVLLPAALAAGDSALPPESEYVQIRDGHLHLDGKRVRFWGGIGSMHYSHPRWDLRRAVDRIEAYGFNMMRLWDVHRSAERQPEGYAKGDGSPLDRHDAMVAELKRRGIRIWFGAAGNGGTARREDAGIIDEPASAAAWQAAIGEKGEGCAHHLATFWDPRLEAIAIRNNSRRLDRVNQHTGLRLADDPAFAIWELTNEQWWMQRMVGGGWTKLPEFFRRSLLVRWHSFLQDRYGSQTALAQRWGGLLPGEDLAQGTVLLAPMRNAERLTALNDANPQAEAKLDSVQTPIGREDVSPHRARDVNEFLAGLLLGHKRRVAEAFKQAGKSTRLSPLLWDTGMGFDGVNQLMHQAADASSYCAYVGGMTHDQAHRRFPWFSGLEEPPRLCLDVPWLEHNRIEGKPFFCYEVNIGSPAKFRSEFPYRVAFLAGIQDWDAVCWHTLSGGYDWGAEDPLAGGISAPGHAAAQFNFTYDEVLISAIRAAGHLFTGGLEPAPRPTTFVYGRRTLFAPASMDYAGSYGVNGPHMLPTTYRYGSRIRLDPAREDDAILGPVVRGNAYGLSDVLQPTPQMTYDWRRGFLRIDTPHGFAFTGFLAQYGSDRVEFGDGASLAEVTVANPPGAPYPVTAEEGYVSIAVASSDGLPLASCRRALVSAVSTSANQNLEVGRNPESSDQPKHPWEAMKVFKGGFKGPVLVSRVGCTLSVPALAGMRYRLRDWRWNAIGEGSIGGDGRLRIEADAPVFVVELER